MRGCVDPAGGVVAISLAHRDQNQWLRAPYTQDAMPQCTGLKKLPCRLVNLSKQCHLIYPRALF